MWCFVLAKNINFSVCHDPAVRIEIKSDKKVSVHCHFESCLWKSIIDILDGSLEINLLCVLFYTLNFT